MPAIKIGTVVRQKVTPIEGPVSDYSLDKATGKIMVCVDYTNDEGDVSQRYFEEDQVEVVPVPAVLLADPAAKKK